MLKTIEILGEHENVFILFNYVPDYKNVYQTWLNVYSWFESKITFSPQNFYDHSQDFAGGRIADNIAAMIAGSTATIDYSERITVEYKYLEKPIKLSSTKAEKIKTKKYTGGYISLTVNELNKLLYTVKGT